ncbi:hypothetical protein [Streptodolium elevatio]|uniref:Uncharacterized protein n=1 Tax=Streptodolium elevatio TaxID=3157996 RepID=A0ABV3DK35_9ACTN
MTDFLYVLAAGLIVFAAILLILLGMSAAASLLLGTSLGVRWLAPRAFRLARRALEALAAAVRDVREPSGRHRRIGDPPPKTADVVWLDPDATHELETVPEEYAA